VGVGIWGVGVLDVWVVGVNACVCFTEGGGGGIGCLTFKMCLSQESKVSGSLSFLTLGLEQKVMPRFSGDKLKKILTLCLDRYGVHRAHNFLQLNTVWVKTTHSFKISTV
jgi:hypothetical protein